MACDDGRSFNDTGTGMYATCTVCGGADWTCRTIMTEQAERIEQLRAALNVVLVRVTKGDMRFAESAPFAAEDIRDALKEDDSHV